MFALRQQSSNTNHRKGKLTSLSLPACAGSWTGRKLNLDSSSSSTSSVYNKVIIVCQLEYNTHIQTKQET
jgi:hypothetical protein